MVSFKLLDLLTGDALADLDVERWKRSFPDTGAVSTVNVNPIPCTIFFEYYVGYCGHFCSHPGLVELLVGRLCFLQDLDFSGRREQFKDLLNINFDRAVLEARITKHYTQRL